MPIRMLKKEEDKKENKKKKPKGSSKLDIFKSYGKYDGKPVELKKGGISKIDKLRAGKGQFTIEGRIQTLKDKLKKKFGKKTGGLTGGQVKLDKNKDGKISGEDFKMMKAKKGKMASDRDRRQKEITEKQNPISEYDRKGKLKYTAANQGGMMAKSTRGYGAARTSGMGLQDEQVKSGKVKPVKAVLGIAAMGLLGAKMLKDKKKKVSPLVGGAAELMKKKKEILGKKTGGPISGPKGGLPRMSDIDKDKIEKLKQQFNRFRNTSTKGGGADESKRMSDKTKQSIKNLVKRIGRLTPAAKIGSDAGKRIRERLKKKIMTPAKKMGGGMMMKQYNKGGSVTASCKLGRNKATKLY